VCSGHARFGCSVSLGLAYDRFAVARRAVGRRMFSRAVGVVPECGLRQARLGAPLTRKTLCFFGDNIILGKLITILLVISLIFMSCATTTCTISQHIHHDVKTPFHEIDLNLDLPSLRHHQGIQIKRYNEEPFYCKFIEIKKEKQEKYNLIYHSFCDSSSLRLPKYLDKIEVELNSCKKIPCYFYSFDFGVLNVSLVNKGDLIQAYISEVKSIRSDHGTDYDWSKIYFGLCENGIPIISKIVYEDKVKLNDIYLHEIEKILIQEKRKFRLNVYLFLLSLIVDVGGTYFIVKLTEGMSQMN